MNRRPETQSAAFLDELYVRWADDIASASPRTYADWKRDYPEHIDLITEWTADYLAYGLDDAAEMEHSPSTVPEVRAEAAVKRVSGAESLLTLARKRGVTADQLSQATGLGATVLSKLNRRMVTPESVPMYLLALLAREIGTTVRAVAATLQGSVRPATAYSHPTRPERRPKSTFAAAVGADPDMPDSAKEAWLAQ